MIFKIKNRTSPFLMCLLCMSLLSIKTVDASGRIEITIKDDLSRQPIPNAQIEILDPNNKKVTNKQGLATFFLIPGQYRLSVEKKGYQSSVSTLEIDEKKSSTITIFLTPATTYEDQITVTAEPVELGLREISAEDVARTAGAGENPFKAMQTTPGILSPSEVDSRLYIRGSPPWENLILLDDVPLYDPYRIFGLVTLFDPATVSYFNIWPGGFPAKYGNRLSAVVEIYNRYGTTEKYLSGSLNTSFTNTSLLIEGKLPTTYGQASWLITARRTYYDILLNAINTGPSKFPYFFDVQTRFYYQLNNRHELSLFSILSHEGTDISEELETEYTTVNFDAIDDQNATIHGFHHYFHLSNQILLTTVLSYYTNSQKTEARVIIGEEAFTSQIELDLETEEWLLQENLEWAINRFHTFEMGTHFAQNEAESLISFSSDDPAVTVPPELAGFRDESSNDKVGFYVQDKWTITDKLIANPGIRYDFGSISGFEEWSPRLTLGYTVKNNKVLKATWGNYYQFPSYESLQGEGLLFNLDNLDDINLKPENAQHYVLGFEDQNPGIYFWSIELYHKELNDLIVGRDIELDVLVLNDDMTTSYRTVETTGIEPYNGEHGFAQGIELLFQKENLFDDRLNLQLSYAYAITKARKTNEDWHYRRYDQRHTVNLIGNFAFTKKWDLSFVWRYGSGFPYSPLGEIITIVEDSNDNGLYEPKLGERISYLEINDPDNQNILRFPSYHRLDARINYSIQRKLVDAIFYLDIINLYDRNNVQGFEYNKDYSEKKEVYGLPFLPTFGVHVTF